MNDISKNKYKGVDMEDMATAIKSGFYFDESFVSVSVISAGVDAVYRTCEYITTLTDAFYVDPIIEGFVDLYEDKKNRDELLFHTLFYLGLFLRETGIGVVGLSMDRKKTIIAPKCYTEKEKITLPERVAKVIYIDIFDE